MASFQTHLHLAAITSLGATALCLQSDHIGQMQGILLFGIGTLAGILPDIDSDHSVPTRLVFKVFGFAVAISVLIALQGKVDMMVLLGLSLAGGLLVRYAAYAIFAALTEHRGLFHSLPAAMLLGLTTIGLGLHVFGWSLYFSWLAAAFASGGYVLHLLLDELYSVDFMGSRLKQSFGTALTVFSRSSWLAYIMLYAATGVGIKVLPMPFG